MSLSLRRFKAVVLIVPALCLAMLGSYAHAATSHPAVVSSNGMDGLPEVVATTGVPKPHVDAIALLGDAGFAAGLFDRIKQGGKTYSAQNLFSFSVGSRAVRTGFQAPPLTGGQIWALDVDPATNSVYVGGDFGYAGGVKRPGLVKLNATTGAIDANFRPPAGKVKDLELVTMAGRKRLVVAGTLAGKIVSLDPATGRNDGFIKLAITDPIPGAWGVLSVYQFAIHPNRTHLAVTGNFTKVNGQARRGFVMANLKTSSVAVGTAGATLSSWYYRGFSKVCSATLNNNTRRIAYLQGIDWSPDGRYFSVAATGQIPAQPSDIWHWWNTDAYKSQTTVCDAVGRFALADSSKPQWINYTGGDSVWSVADTGKAVYAQGHFKWMDNPDGYASAPARWDGAGCPEPPAWPEPGVVCKPVGDKKTGELASRRSGIVAIDPVTGRSIQSWHPAMPVSMGGKALLATGKGLWIGSDSKRYGSENHHGLVFAPLP